MDRPQRLLKDLVPFTFCTFIIVAALDVGAEVSQSISEQSSFSKVLCLCAVRAKIEAVFVILSLSFALILSPGSIR